MKQPEEKENRQIVMFDSTQLDNEIVGTAYYRLDKHFVDFLRQCEDKHTIVGFEYDFNDPFNIGFMLGEEKKPTEDK